MSHIHMRCVTYTYEMGNVCNVCHIYARASESAGERVRERCLCVCE